MIYKSADMVPADLVRVKDIFGLTWEKNQITNRWTTTELEGDSRWAAWAWLVTERGPLEEVK